MPRLFIAIDFNKELKQLLETFRVPVSGARWVPQEQLHLTLAFLGDVDGKQVSCLTDSLEKLHSPSFNLQWAGAGCFPDRRRPHVLWVGLKPQSLLNDLVARIRAAAGACHIELEARPFVPHLTLARVKLPAASGIDLFFNHSKSIVLPTVHVNEFILFESNLTSRGAIHKVVRSFSLY